MKTNGSYAFSALTCLSLMLAHPASADDAIRTAEAHAQGSRYIFVLKEQFTGDVGARARSVAYRGRLQLEHTFDQALRGFTLETTAVEAEKIVRSNPDIAFAEPDVSVSVVDDFTPAPQQVLQQAAETQVVPWGVTRVGTCARGTCDLPSNVANARVWIIDSGIAPHPDLNIDWSRAFSSVGEDGVDRLGHGTHVAGTVGAINNNIGVVGVAPGATLVPVQVVDRKGGGSISSIIEGVEYVAAQRRLCPQTIGCEPQKWVANMSLTSDDRSLALDLAVLRASRLGVRFAIAAGNRARPAIESSPGHLQRPNLFTVSASCGPASLRCVNGKDSIASFSNYGNPPVDVAAPGDEVYSTSLDGTYATGHGTSMASPHVAGLLARIPGLTTQNLWAHYCGRLTTDRDKSRDRIAFVYGSRSSFCTLAKGQTPEPPPVGEVGD